MANHPLIVQIRPDGRTTLIFHPTLQAADAARFNTLGTVIAERRGAHVVPQAPGRRLAFRALRRLCGSRGRIAAWTRRWRGAWIVVDAETRRPLPGPAAYPSHAAAVAAEVQWILNHRKET